MELRDKRILYKIRIEALHIMDFIKDLNFDAFTKNEITKRAVAMTIVNIGELVRALSDNAKSQYNDIPWTAIRQTRNVISHDYEAVDFARIWQTAFVDIPILIEKIDSIERDIGLELYGEAERAANYDEILKSIKDADDNGV
ncbi:MAG: DUF86 domain-containing protein [Defluviitaleaceae bacterium]|nr:DUF86 domain-containing protein [Defluviitaleaceae bacterium]